VALSVKSASLLETNFNSYCVVLPTGIRLKSMNARLSGITRIDGTRALSLQGGAAASAGHWSAVR